MRFLDSRKKQPAFTLLLAALISSIVLALGTAIYEIAEKELTLSSIGRDSQFAFYAADSGAECALYWDFRCSYFSATTPSTCTAASPLPPTCDGQPMGPFTVTDQNGNPEHQPYTYPYTEYSAPMNFFEDTTPDDSGYCVQVQVQKTFDSSAQAVRTVVEADGYSVDCNDIDSSPQSLQRTVELHY